MGMTHNAIAQRILRAYDKQDCFTAMNSAEKLCLADKQVMLYCDFLRMRIVETTIERTEDILGQSFANMGISRWK